MAKKEKPIEKQRKAYKARGIFYLVMIVLLIVVNILLSVQNVEMAVNRMVYPSSETLTIDGEKREVFSEITKEEGVYVSAFYYLDQNGEKVYVSPYTKLTPIAMVKTSFDSSAKITLSIIKTAAKLLLGLFAVLLVIYLLRFSYYLSNKDAEWNARMRDRLLNIQVFFDKIATLFSSKSAKKKAVKQEDKDKE